MSIKRVYRKRPEAGYYYVYDLYIDGRRVRTPRGEYFPTKEECNDAVSSIRTDYRRGKYQFPADRSTATITDLRDAWTKRLKGLGRSVGYVARVSRCLTALAQAARPATALVDLRSIHLERYRAAAIAGGLKPQTANAEMTVVMSALNGASEVFESLRDWRPPRKPKSSSSVSGRERIITRDEESKIIAALSAPRERLSDFYARSRKQLARVFWIALRTGMREGEILGLHKSKVSFDRAITMPNGWIEVRRSHGSDKTKTGKLRLIPMTPAVAEVMKQQIAHSESVYVFPSPLDSRGRWASFRIGFMEACRVAKVPYGRETTDGLVFHDTRHTAATRMLHSGYDLKTVGAILGHSDEYMTMKYAHSTASSRYAAVSSIGNERFGVQMESISSPNEVSQDHSGSGVGGG